MRGEMKAIRVAAVVLAVGACAAATAPRGAGPQSGAPQPPGLPSGPLKFGAFTAAFAPRGVFSLEGQGWPALAGTWTATGSTVEIVMPGGPKGCTDPGRYTFKVDGQRVGFSLQSDTCETRRMILDRSTWSPAGAPAAVAVRRIVRTAGSDGPLPPAGSAAGSWPSFRGAQAS